MANGGSDSVERGLEDLADSFEQLDRRLAGVEARLGGSSSNTQDELADIRSKGRRKFYWLTGAIITSAVVRTILAFM